MTRFASSLVFPSLGKVYAALDGWTLPLLRFVAGFNMAMHGWVHVNADMARLPLISQAKASSQDCSGPMR